jgi:L-ascorbate metabolism protein UlaG (beta-lactamase superfamily)
MNAEHEGLSFERPGHATVRIETDDGTVVYVDPWTEVIDGMPDDADVVFVTHDDYDHYDPDAIRAVSTAETAIAAFEGVDTSDLGMDVTPIPEDGEATVAGIEVQAVPAYNRPDGEHVRESGEPYHPEGTVIGLLLTIDGTTVHVVSDTDFLEEHRDIDADVLIPPIGGNYTMDRHEAAEMAEAIGPDLVLPVHYDTAEIGGIDADAEAFEADLEAAGVRVVLI